MPTRLALAEPVATGGRRAEGALFVTGEAGFLTNRASRVVSWNRAAERLTGIPSARAIGCFWETLVAASGAANAIARSERPMPAIMLWRAIAIDRRPT